MDGPIIAIIETTSDSVFFLNSALTTKDNNFRTAPDEACDAFNAVMLEMFDLKTHQVNLTQTRRFY